MILLFRFDLLSLVLSLMTGGTRIDQLETSTGELREAQSKLDGKMVELREEFQKSHAIVETKMSVFSEQMARVESLILQSVRGKAKVEIGGSSEMAARCDRKTEVIDGGNNYFPGRNLKVEVPRFDGTDVEDWIFKIKEFFELYSTPLNQRIRISSLHMGGAAFKWYQWLVENDIHYTWPEFVDALLLRFGRTVYDDPKAALKRVVQTGTVAEYYSAFEGVATQIKGLAEEFYVSFFIEGLQEHLQCDVLLAQPANLQAAVAIAKLHERKHAKVQALNRSPYSRYNTFSKGGSNFSPVSASSGGSFGVSNDVVSTGKGGVVSKSANETPVVSKETSYKKLTVAELKARREKGLCYYCDAKYSRNHQCKAAFNLLLGQEELHALLHGDSEDEEEFVEVSNELMNLTPAISLNAIEGDYHPKTLRVTGFFKKEALRILIDCGSSSNFIKASAVKRLHMKTVPVKEFRVVTGGGEKLVCDQKCEQVSLVVQDTKIVVDLYVLEVTGCDIVLGIQWLAELGNIVANFKKMMISFMLDGRHVQFQGDSLINPEPLSHKLLQKSISHDSVAGIFALQCLPTTEQFTSGVEQVPACIQSVLEDFVQVFREPTELPPQRGVDHVIELLPGKGPVNVRPYRYPQFQKEEIERLVDEMLKTGVIRDSQSSFSSPVLLVKKKDGTWRFCVDYRALNEATVKDKFPIPTIDEIMDELQGSAYFSKLDLRAGYHQIRMREADIHKTAFRTHLGHYEFVVMPFGLTNAPATFQYAMNRIFKPFLRKFVTVFFDDILVYSKTLEEHVGHLQAVLNVLVENVFFAKLSKCSFCQTSIDYLGHVVSKEGVAVDQQKIKAMVEWPRPTTIKQLRGFLGLTGYYRKFVRHYAQVAYPLTDLLKKNQFQWSQVAQDAFDSLKTLMTETPVLALPNFSKVFVVETDASNKGVGAVLSQDGHPLAYFSKKLTSHLAVASAYVRELYAVTQSVLKWRHYLLGRHFIIKTDHKSLRELMFQVVQTPEQQYYVTKLMGFQFTVVYRAGKTNQVADALSRIDDDG